jgi:glutamyl-Q tRNA(Asp) synthetase
VPAHRPAPYVGRFAPSPTGALHAGSLVAALASWLDARAHGGRWLVRIEDVDAPRCVPGADTAILAQLRDLGLHPDAPPVWQSQRNDHYRAALDQLLAAGWAYPCACSRSDIVQAMRAAGLGIPRRHEGLIYCGTCRAGLGGKTARAWRVRTDLAQNTSSNKSSALFNKALPAIRKIAKSPLVDDSNIHWLDRVAGPQHQDVEREVGDFVLLRADGLWAYQLAVVVDDADQGITHIVRGVDLMDNTARQILLQRALGLPTPHYLHVPLVRNAAGEKLSKQSGAEPLDLRSPTHALWTAAQFLGLEPQGSTRPTGIAPEALVERWIQLWRHDYVRLAPYNPPP